MKRPRGCPSFQIPILNLVSFSVLCFSLCIWKATGGTVGPFIRRIRQTEGKHVIPVPTFEIKKDFSGYLLDPLQIFKTKGKGQKPYIAEKSIIRPTFSYLGNFTISDSVFREIVEYLASKMPEIHKILRTRANNTPEGPVIYMEVSVVYGYNVVEGLAELKRRAKREIENLTAMNVQSIDIVAKSVYMPEVQ